MAEFPKPSITSVVEHYGGRVVGTDMGGWRRVACPIHDDQNPSASLNEDHCWFRCFYFDFSGDAVDLIERITGARPVDAIETAKGFLGEGDGDLRSSDGPHNSLLPHGKRNRKGDGTWIPPWHSL